MRGDLTRFFRRRAGNGWQIQFFQHLITGAEVQGQAHGRGGPKYRGRYKCHFSHGAHGARADHHQRKEKV